MNIKLAMRSLFVVVSLFIMGSVAAKNTGTVTRTSAPSQTQQDRMTDAQQRAEFERQQQLQKEQQRQRQKQQQQGQESQNPVSVVQNPVPVIVDVDQQLDNMLYDLGSLKKEKGLIRDINDFKKLKLTPAQTKKLKHIENELIKQKKARARVIAKKRTKKEEAFQARQGLFTSLWDRDLGIRRQLNDSLLYPTLNSQKEALDLGIEFFDPAFDVDMFRRERDILKKQLIAQKLSAEEKKAEEKIDKMIAELRDTYGFDLSGIIDMEDLQVEDVGEYNKNLKENVINFIKDNKTEDIDIVTILRALLSEIERTQNMIDTILLPEPNKKNK